MDKKDGFNIYDPLYQFAIEDKKDGFNIYDSPAIEDKKDGFNI